MPEDTAANSPCTRVICVGNEKGGSGKSTVAIHIAIALLRAGQSVASIDLDGRQRSFTHYIDNRLAWGRQRGRDLPAPTHVCLDDEAEFSGAQDAAAAIAAFNRTLETLAATHSYVVIDSPGAHHDLVRAAHAAADILVTPLNDSFVDLDVIASVDPETFAVAGTSHYALVVEEARAERQTAGKPPIDWIVLRNRLTALTSRNKRFIDQALQDLSQRLGFRYVEGLAERVIFREFYPRGLTAADELDKFTLGTRPTMSHMTAQMEVQSLMASLLRLPQQSDESVVQADAA